LPHEKSLLTINQTGSVFIEYAPLFFMKKLIVLFLYTLFSISITFSQPYYSKMFDVLGGWESAACFIPSENGNNKILGTSIDFFDDSLKYRRSFYATLLSDLELVLDTVNYLKGEYHVMSTTYFNLNNRIKYIYAIDSSNSTRKYYLQDLTYYLKYNKIIESPILINENLKLFRSTSSICLQNKRIYLFGNSQNSTTAPFAILCIDTIGRQLWYKTYPGRRYFTSGIAIDDDGNFLLGGGGYRGDGGAFDTFYKWIAKMDTSGNFIWEHKYEDSVIYGGGLPIIINGSYYWLGDKSNVGEIAYSFIIKTDRNGNKVWAKELMRAASPYSFYPVVNGFYSPVVRNDHIYATGYEVESFDSGYTFKDFVLLAKIDTLGNLKWKRRFSQWYKDNRAFSLTAVPDGFIICADGKDTTHTTGFTDAWIIKTDTNGCIIPGCHLADGLVQLTNPDAFVTVYPNPATDNITVQITDNRAKLKSYLLYDSKGNFIKQHQLPNNPETVDIATDKLSAGNYYLVLELQGGERAVKKIMIQR